MSNPVPSPKPSVDGKPTAVIRRVPGVEETPHQRLVKKHIPAWVISGAVHVALIAALITIDRMLPDPLVAAQSDE